MKKGIKSLLVTAVFLFAAIYGFSFCLAEEIVHEENKGHKIDILDTGEKGEDAELSAQTADKNTHKNEVSEIEQKNEHETGGHHILPMDLSNVPAGIMIFFAIIAFSQIIIYKRNKKENAEHENNNHGNSH